jgi:hypothetical protein
MGFFTGLGVGIMIGGSLGALFMAIGVMAKLADEQDGQRVDRQRR